jgi:hypothetical protein
LAAPAGRAVTRRGGAGRQERAAEVEELIGASGAEVGAHTWSARVALAARRPGGGADAARAALDEAAAAGLAAPAVVNVYLAALAGASEPRAALAEARAAAAAHIGPPAEWDGYTCAARPPRAATCQWLRSPRAPPRPRAEGADAARTLEPLTLCGAGRRLQAMLALLARAARAGERGAGAEAGGLLDSAAAAGCAPPPPTASRAVCCGPEAGYSCSEAGQRGAGRGRVDVKVYTSALLAVAADIRGRAAAEAALERAGGVLKHAKALGPAPAPAPAPARAAGSAGPPRVTAAPFDFSESNGSKQV